jgi:TonB family protein
MRSAACLWFAFLPVLILAQAAPEKQKIICDHAAPPRGMHYVCKSQCDCHLEGTLKNDGDGIAPANQPSEENQPSTCQAVPTFIFAPPYPRVAQVNRIAGTVYIQVEIGDRGNVSNASIQQGHPQLAGAALNAARKWVFSSGCSKMQTVRMRFEITFEEDEKRLGFEYRPDDREVVIIAPSPKTSDPTVTTTRVIKIKPKASSK